MSHFLKSQIGPNLRLEFNESKHLDLYRGSRRRWWEGVPYLRLRLLSIYVDTLSLEFDPKATMGVDIELVGKNRWGNVFKWSYVYQKSVYQLIENVMPTLLLEPVVESNFLFN